MPMQAYASGTELTGAGAVQLFSGVFGFSDALFLVTGPVEFSGTVIFDADQTLDSVRYDRVKIQSSGNLTLTGSSLLNGLTLEGTGTATIAAGATMSVGGFDATFRRPVENFGTLRTNNNHVSIGATFINRPGAELIFNSGGDLHSATAGTESIVNEGTFTKIGDGLAKVFFNLELQNTGTIEIQNGELDLSTSLLPSDGAIVVAEGATLTINRFSTLDLLDGGVLTGGGTIQGEVINQGTVQPGDGVGTLTINGDYTQATSGKLDLEIAGADPNLHDRLIVTGAAEFAGALHVAFVGGFGPLDGETFDVVRYAALSGDFAEIAATGLLESQLVEADLQADRLLLAVSPNTSQPAAVLQTFNAGILAERDRASEYGEGFNSDVGGLPFFPSDAGPLSDLLNIGDTLAELSASQLNTIDTVVTTFDGLREQLETAGYIVQCVRGDAECTGGELLRVRSITVPHDLSASLSTDGLSGTPLAGLVENGLFSGEISIGGRLTVDRGFGVDAEGFFVTADSLISVPLTLQVSVSGDVGIFGLGIAAEFRLTPEFRVTQLDTNGDGKLRGGDFDNLLAGHPFRTAVAVRRERLFWGRSAMDQRAGAQPGHRRRRES